jgi:type IV secretory pathway VirJ component
MNGIVRALAGAIVLYALPGFAPAIGQTDIPGIVDLPPKQQARAIGIVYSGDGGWQDLDKTIGEWMTTQGFHVVGVSTVKAFWKSREPATAAADFEKMLANADPSGSLPVLVVGYSFGADIFPFAWPFLKQPTQNRIKLIALLAPERHTAFHVSIEGWLGVDTGDHLVSPAIAALPGERVICVYGEEDADTTACTEVKLDGMAVTRTTGGHHFDEDYVGLGWKILAAFDQRS